MTNLNLHNVFLIIQIDKKVMKTSGMVARVRNEVEIHCQLKHPTILEVYMHSSVIPRSGKHAFIVMLIEFVTQKYLLLNYATGSANLSLNLS